MELLTQEHLKAVYKGDTQRAAELSAEMDQLPPPERACVAVRVNPGDDGGPEGHCRWCHAGPVHPDHEEACETVYRRRTANAKQRTQEAVAQLRPSSRERWEKVCPHHQQLTTLYHGKRGQTTHVVFKHCGRLGKNKRCCYEQWEKLDPVEQHVLKCIPTRLIQAHIQTRLTKRATEAKVMLAAKTHHAANAAAATLLDQQRTTAFDAFVAAAGHVDKDTSFNENSKLSLAINEYIAAVDRCEDTSVKSKHEVESGQLLRLILGVSEMRASMEEASVRAAEKAANERVGAIKHNVLQLQQKDVERKKKVEEAILAARDAQARDAQARLALSARSTDDLKAANAQLAEKVAVLDVEKDHATERLEELHLMMVFRSVCDDLHRLWSISRGKKNKDKVQDEVQQLADVPVGWHWHMLAHSDKAQTQWVEWLQTHVDLIDVAKGHWSPSGDDYFCVFQLLRFLGNSQRHHNGSVCRWLLDNIQEAYKLVARILTALQEPAGVPSNSGRLLRIKTHLWCCGSDAEMYVSIVNQRVRVATQQKNK